MARRPGPTNPRSNDDPWAWEAREFLRKMLIGKSVLCSISHKVPSGREYGQVLFGSTDPDKAENVAVKLLSEGLAKARDNCSDPAFTEAQEAAKAAGKGLHSDTPMSEHIRSITWEVENPRQLVDRMGGQPIDAIIESVRDGSTVRAFLLPDFYHVTLMMSGMRCPALKSGPDGKPLDFQEDFALEAQYFTESRLLQRDVKIVLESSNNKTFVGSVIHPNGNIAEALLREGLGKTVDWSMACVTGGPAKYRQAETAAKEKKIRLWRNYEPSGVVISARDKEFTGKVLEIVNGDAIMVKKNKTETKKIFLASIRAPRLSEEDRANERPRNFRPLYDIPYMFEAREFLRKKLIGQNVHVIVDFIQPASDDGYPEKICGTITIGGVNVAEALVSKGLASVVRYSAGNDQRSSHYDDLLSAEEKANIQREATTTGMKKKQQDAVMEMNEQCDQLSKMKTKVEQDKNKIIAEVGDVRAATDEVNRSKASAEKSYRNLLNNLNDLNKKVEESNLHLGDLEAFKRRLTAENADVLRQLQELQNNASLLTKTRAGLVSSLDEAKGVADHEAKERVSLLGKYRNLEHELDGLKQAFDEEVGAKDNVSRQVGAKDNVS